MNMMIAKPVNAHRFPRAKDEWYVEEPRATEFLLRQMDFPGLTLDPCCGQGNIVSVMRAHGYNAIGKDLRNRTRGEAWFKGTHDFRRDPIPEGVDNIVMNPPFGRAVLAEAFIRRALSLGVTIVAAFVEARFLFGEDRAQGLYRDLPPTSVHPVTPRVSCPPGDYLLAGGTAQGGTADHVWIVWKRDPDGGLPTQTQFHWKR